LPGATLSETADQLHGTVSLPTAEYQQKSNSANRQNLQERPLKQLYLTSNTLLTSRINSNRRESEPDSHLAENGNIDQQYISVSIVEHNT
jgi:hypothetical protein